MTSLPLVVAIRVTATNGSTLLKGIEAVCAQFHENRIPKTGKTFTGQLWCAKITECSDRLPNNIQDGRAGRDGTSKGMQIYQKGKDTVMKTKRPTKFKRGQGLQYIHNGKCAYRIEVVEQIGFVIFCHAVFQDGSVQRAASLQVLDIRDLDDLRKVKLGVPWSAIPWIVTRWKSGGAK